MEKRCWRGLNIVKHWFSKGINSFLQTLNSIFLTSFPIKRKIINTKTENRLSWITKGIKVASQMKRFLNSRDKNRCHSTIIEYRKKYLSIYKSIIIVAKKMGIHDQLSKAKSKSKKIWDIINRHRNATRKPKTESIRLINK